MNSMNHKSDFVHVNGVRLHYLDWGGNGPTLIFLAGMGSSAYIFNQFAPRFADKFHVLALTRRGQSDSDCPETGYDADTLTEDILQFMERMQIKKTILAGHSLAGVELTHFAATHPERVSKLVYLDALDDRREEGRIMEQNPLRRIKLEKVERFPHSMEEYVAGFKMDFPGFAAIWSDLWDEEFSHGLTVNEQGIFVDRMPAFVEKMMVENLIRDYAPKKMEAKIPILAFYVLKKPILSNVYTEEQKTEFLQFEQNLARPFFWSLISEFQARFPHAKTVVIPDGHHYCFIAQEEQVYAEMRKFLLE